MTGATEGLLLVHKPAGPTSHDVVDRARRLFGQRKIGHAGTLDPLATGLLPLVLGRATRLVRFLALEPKVYRGSFDLGVRTVTDDLDGVEIARHEGALPETDRVIEAAAALRGALLQVPPAVSARKVEGERLYRLSRRGVEVAPPPTPVVVHRFELAATDRREVFRFEAEVSSGTYVRALVRDLGRALGCGAAVRSLERVRLGPLSLDDATSLEDDPDRALASVIPLEAMPLGLPSVRLVDPDTVRRFGSGCRLPPPDPHAPPGECRVTDDAGRLLGIGRLTGASLEAIVVLAGGG